MFGNNRPVSILHNQNQSIDDFPLPPCTPRHGSLSNAMQDDSVPEFDRNFRFPNNDVSTNHDDDLDDPEHTFMRLKNEVEILTARLARDFTDLDSSISSQPQTKNYPNETKCRISTRNIDTRPKTSYGRVEAPRFSFRDFDGWDIKDERDETRMAGRYGDNHVQQQQISTRARASSLRNCQTQRQMKDKPNLVIPVHARKYLIAQERARIDQEREAEEERRRILAQTREAVAHISEAGFDFGFEGTGPMVDEITKCSKVIPATTPETAESESNIKTTVIKIPPKEYQLISTPPSTHNSATVAWPSRAESTHWPGWGHSDSGVALASPPLSPKSAPPPITCFPDLPEPLRVTRTEKLSPSTSLNVNEKFTKPSRQELSCWSASPDISQNENLGYLVEEVDDKEKRRGFWRRMKSSVFSRKKSTFKTKEFVEISTQ
ncbi:hypothetical protein HI914_05647 [Erysiphe necator]|uniref:Uncharacterized protein n=1 Tax=Uncinula necator TaxID=52586 RepID=A0A0B1PC77_UNCNE|nr:hypothetical protein HI914_05647 [Erysiphe necator]KHJ34965.1 hypothetical protein EV44_g2568 [Erysiphe necator]